VRVYRAFLVDRQGNVIRPPEVLYCADDDEAFNGAQQLVDGCNVEVWDRERFIAFIGSNGVKVRHEAAPVFPLRPACCVRGGSLSWATLRNIGKVWTGTFSWTLHLSLPSLFLSRSCFS
jgi:hypothetical protein